ncbi:MAG TPA: orotate phosphoribosyltransferase [bacterium]|nr:orotate phosphoribosyltransferase [bacterium]HOL66449.1 orotate phosphoribosyltransferase [bacterium]
MDDIRKILEECQAVLKGHFLLSSGLHSDTYFQMALVFQRPECGQRCSRLLAEKLAGFNFSAVIGPALGGIILAYELGRLLGLRAMFAEREAGVMSLRRGFSLKPGEPVLICEDVITTGGSVKEVMELVRKHQACPEAVACLVQRGQVDLGLPLFSLLQVKVNQYRPEECPLCQQGLALVKLGSRGLR